MKKIKEERIKIQNLKNIRIAYIVQTIGILIVLANDLMKKGLAGMTKNPVWYVFLVTAIVSAFLSMSVSVHAESKPINPKQRLFITLFIILFISIAISLFVALTNGFNIVDGIIIGGIIFVCAFIPTTYIYYLRSKRL